VPVAFIYALLAIPLVLGSLVYSYYLLFHWESLEYLDREYVGIIEKGFIPSKSP